MLTNKCVVVFYFYFQPKNFCDLSQNLSVQRGLGNNNDGLKKIVMSLSNNSVLRG